MVGGFGAPPPLLGGHGLHPAAATADLIVELERTLALEQEQLAVVEARFSRF